MRFGGSGWARRWTIETAAALRLRPQQGDLRLLRPGRRLRLYLVDLPEGMSVQTMAITVVAPEERFDDVIEETEPIIDSIEFHPG